MDILLRITLYYLKKTNNNKSQDVLEMTWRIQIDAIFTHSERNTVGIRS